MTGFTDLRLNPLIEDIDQVKRMVTKSATLGYRRVGIPLPPNITQNRLGHLTNICSEAGVELITRVNVSPRTSHELQRDLRRLRQRFVLVAVICKSKHIARLAAKDRRVDLIAFSSKKGQKRFFDRTEAKLVADGLSCLEIPMEPLLVLEGFARIRLLSRLRREVDTARRYRSPIVLSSGATREEHLRSPHEYAALAALFGETPRSALLSISERPNKILERNQQKLRSDYLAPGVRVMRRRRE